jgi:GT2 family glycosyltransferase
LAQPLISIVIPTFNRRETLLEALASVRRQDLAEFECIVVDNGPSTDGTADAVAEFSQADPRFRLIKTGAIGIFPSANMGIRESEADVVLLMDDDVELVDRKTLRYVTERFETDYALGVFGLSEFYPEGKHRGHEKSVAKRGAWTYLRDTRLYPPGMVSRWGLVGTKFHQLPFGKVFSVDHVRSSAMAMRRAVFEAVGGFDDVYSVKGRGYRCETDLCVRVRRAGHAVRFSACDPQVLHKQAPRMAGYDRSGFDRDYLESTGCNNTFFFLRNYWSKRTAPVFMALDMLVGNSSQPGFLRLLKAGQWSPATHWHAIVGKWMGLRLFWRRGTAGAR